jgi:hypothetical protein
MDRTLNDISTEYYNLKKQLEELTQKYETVEKSYKARLDVLKQEIMIAMNSTGVKQFKTDQATFHFVTKKHVNCADKEAFFQWIRENNRWDMLQKTPLKTAVLEYMENEQSLPAGLTYYAAQEIGYRSN